MRRFAPLAAALVISTVIAGILMVPSMLSSSAARSSSAFEGPVPEAECGPGSAPEVALQGRVPLRHRASGRSRQGYRCNLEMLGRFRGEGSSWVSQSYRNCAYMSTRSPNDAEHPGVQVLDVSEPRNPHRVGTLTDPAMLATWETLKVNRERGLLAAVNAPSTGGNGAAFFAVYDIRPDCSKPRLLNSVSSTELSIPANALGHEGNWAPDGRTYWATSLYGGGITAIDVADTSHPRIVFTGQTSAINHGLSVSNDGNRLYIARIGFDSGAPLDDNGLQIYDVSEVQQREPAPQIRLVGQTLWRDGAIGQHAIRVSYDGRPYLVYVDEGGAGAARIFDISDEGVPRVVSKLKLEIHMPEHADLRERDTEGTGFFGYEGHYCDVDRLRDPTALACGYFQSGVRVFDIRHPRAPREIAYFNPPAQVGKRSRLESSEHAKGPVVSEGGQADLTTDWCSSPPRFVDRQLWVTCQDNGFMALRFTNGAYPFPSS
jgi:hypothetical protein